MGDRYFVGNGVAIGANWNRTANWAAISGGAGGQTVPGPADNAYFDGNSGDCIIDVAASPGELDTTGYGGNTLNFGGYLIQVGVGGLNHQGGTIISNGQLVVSGPFTVAGGATWTDGNGSIEIDTNCAWNASITTTYLRWVTPNTTITVTAGNTITILKELFILGDQTNNIVVTAAGNYTLDLDAGIIAKEISHATLDHMQLGAGDTAIAYFSTDNGNNDADITFTANTDRVGSVSGQWSAAATWGGSAAPTSGQTWSIDLGVTVTLEGQAEGAGGYIYGALIMDGQTDGTPTPAVLTLDAGSSLIIIGSVAAANSDDIGYIAIASATPGGTKIMLVPAGAGTMNPGPSAHISDVCICGPIVILNGKKMVMDGECGIGGGLEVQAGGEWDQQGQPLIVNAGNLVLDGTHTFDGPLTFLGTHNISGTNVTLPAHTVGS